MAVNVVSAQSAPTLMPRLAERLATRMDDPFCSDVVVVPSIGVADHIIEALTELWGSSGLVANTKFWLPNEFNINVGANNGSPLVLADYKSARWLIFEYLVVRSQLGNEPAPGFLAAKKKFSFSQRVAQLFERYAVHRPEMIAAWTNGSNTDGFRELPEHLKWQPILWRELVAESISRSEGQIISKIDGGVGSQFDLTRTRITLFGMESFSRAKIELLRQVSASSDVCVFHLSPYPSVVKAMRDIEVVLSAVRRETALPYSFKNPLLRSWGQSSLENGALLSTVTSHLDHLEPQTNSSLLSVLQKLFADDDEGSGLVDSQLLQKGDGSIQIHLCHGETRQVEVLRDALLHLMHNDPTLRPRDVLVICKDIENFEPLLEPIMAARLGDRGQHLSVTVLDSVAATATPVAAAIDSLLSLLSSRCTLLEVLELLSLEPIRKKFKFSDECLSKISRWTSNLNVKWGLDGVHRENWGIPKHFEHGTWTLAIDRLVAGILNQSHELNEHFPGVAAYDDLSGSDIETVGRLHQFVTAVSDIIHLGNESLTIGEWSQLLDSLVDNFLDVPPDQKPWLLDARALADSLHRQSAVASTAKLTLGEFREVVAEGLPTVRNASRKWHDVVRVGTPARLRGVPARVIAILGFDDDIFRNSGAAGDDILAVEPRLGERDVRLEERLGLLSAINAAADYFLVTSNGHDVNNNKPIPRPVPLIELQDSIALAVSTIPDLQRQSIPVLISHSRQLADPVNVGLPGDSDEKNVQLLSDRPWTFDQTAVQVVARLSDPETRHRETMMRRNEVVLDETLESDSQDSLQLAELIESVRRPIDVFVQSRLGVLLPRAEDAPDASLPLWPDGLKYAEIGRDVLAGLSDGLSISDLRAVQDLAGNLPFGELGNLTWSKITAETDEITAAVREILGRNSNKFSFELTSPDLTAPSPSSLLLAQVQVHGDILLSMNFARWHRRFRLTPWFQLAALTLHQPDVHWKAFIVARSHPPARKKKDEVLPPFVIEEFVLKGDTSDERRSSATRVLTFGLTIHSRARRGPVPLFERSSWIPEKSMTDRKSDLALDLQRPSHQLVYEGFEFEDFLAEELIPDLDRPLLEGTSRYEAYANLLVRTWGETCEVVRDAEPKKSKKTQPSVTNSAVEQTAPDVSVDSYEGD